MRNVKIFAYATAATCDGHTGRTTESERGREVKRRGGKEGCVKCARARQTCPVIVL